MDKIEIFQQRQGQIKEALEKKLVKIADLELSRIENEGSDVVCLVEDGQDKFVFKMFTNESDKNAFHSSLKFGQLAQKNDISVPEMIAYEENGQMLSFPWILWKRVDGVSLYKIESDEKKGEAAVLTGKELRKIHDVTVDGFGEWRGDDWSMIDIKKVLGFFEERLINLSTRLNENESLANTVLL